MHHIWWFLIAVTLIILVAAAWNALRSSCRRFAMQRRLRRFEQEQRVRQQAAVMRRTRKINALAHETCQAILNAALKAEAEASKSSKHQRRCQ